MDAYEKLARELGEAPPDSFRRLDYAQLQALATAIGAARKRQEEALSESAEDGLDFIPRLLRKPVKKIVFG